MNATYLWITVNADVDHVSDMATVLEREHLPQDLRYGSQHRLMSRQSHRLRYVGVDLGADEGDIRLLVTRQPFLQLLP